MTTFFSEVPSIGETTHTHKHSKKHKSKRERERVRDLYPYLVVVFTCQKIEREILSFAKTKQKCWTQILMSVKNHKYDFHL